MTWVIIWDAFISQRDIRSFEPFLGLKDEEIYLVLEGCKTADGWEFKNYWDRVYNEGNRCNISEARKVRFKSQREVVDIKDAVTTKRVSIARILTDFYPVEFESWRKFPLMYKSSKHVYNSTILILYFLSHFSSFTSTHCRHKILEDTQKKVEELKTCTKQYLHVRSRFFATFLREKNF